MIYFFFSTSITPSVMRFTIIGVFSFRKPSVDLTSTISPFISAYPIRARRVVVTPVSPIFTFSSALQSIFEVIFFFKAILSKVLERINHISEPTQAMADTASVMNPAVVPILVNA